LLATACEREALPSICPDVQEGELVVTELRGEQDGSDTYGQWIELAYTGAGKIDLEGVHVVLQPGDGSASARLIVREPTTIEEGEYVVLGKAETDAPPMHVDYGFGEDFSDGLDPGGIIEVYACDVLVDRLVYKSLPTLGTWSFDGSKTPDPDANDDETCWCADESDEPPPGPVTEIGIAGTPGLENRPCE
jgi:hypothetical protein